MTRFFTYIKLGIIGVIIIQCISCKPKASAAYTASLMKHRTEYKKHFQENERSPLRTDEELSLMDFYEADESYICKCTVSKENAGDIITISTYANKQKDYRNFGTAQCTIKGEEFTLSLFQYAQAFGNPIAMKQIFLPFKDYTNGVTTYGGGRYMDLSTEDVVNNTITLDFNKAYNPWCAYSDGYNCPIPPASNHLKFELEAGEKMYLGPHKYN